MARGVVLDEKFPFAFSSPKKFHLALMNLFQSQAELGVWAVDREHGLFPTRRSSRPPENALASALSETPSGVLA